MFDWFWSFLYSLGLFKKDASVLLLGLDNAGKTTLMHKLKYGSIHHCVPTQRAQLQEIDLGRLKLKAWDLGGHLQVRSLWKEYFVDVDAIIFVIDTTDKERFEEVKKELFGLLEEEDLKETSFLILGNKIDLIDACNREDLIFHLGISHLIGEKDDETRSRSLEVFMVSLVKSVGIEDAFSWLSQNC